MTLETYREYRAEASSLTRREEDFSRILVEKRRSRNPILDKVGYNIIMRKLHSFDFACRSRGIHDHCGEVFRRLTPKIKGRERLGERVSCNIIWELTWIRLRDSQ